MAGMKRLVILALFLASCAHTKSPAPAAQNPSPMVENTREHVRVVRRALAGRVLTLPDILPKPVEVDITPAAERVDRVDLVVHFLGASWLPMMAAEDTKMPIVIAVVNLGAGSAVYAKPFRDPATFTKLIAAIESATGKHFARKYLVGFSAGYGAARSILGTHYDEIDGVLLLDGLHTSYIPERKPLADGGKIDESGLEIFLKYATDAVAGKKRFVITHSEIFPGTFASTTETTDWLIQKLSLKRTAVVQWGPLGMQQLSETSSGLFTVLGFAGNSAPDHIDHLHASGKFLQILLNAPFVRTAESAIRNPQLDLPHLVVADPQSCCSDILLEVLDLRRSRNREHHGRTPEQPGKRDL